MILTLTRLHKKGNQKGVEATLGTSFRRQFIDLWTGTMVAQVLSFALMPIVTRLYSPAQVGEYQLYASISSIIGLIANLRLDLTVVIAGSDIDARILAWLGILASLIIGVLSFLAMVFWRPWHDPLLLWIVLSIAATGIIQTLVNWHSRRKDFMRLSQRNLAEKMVVLALGLGLGWLGYTNYGLIASQSLGLLVSIIVMAYFNGPTWPPGLKALWRQTLIKFKDFPTHNVVSSIVYALALFLPSVLMAENFSREELGFFSLANRNFDVAINLVGYTFSTVYYQHVSNLTAASRMLLFKKSLRLLSLALGIPLLIVALWGGPLFSLVFGKIWYPSGQLAIWLAPHTFFRLLFVSQNPILMVGRRLDWNLIISVLIFISQVGGYYLGLYLRHDLTDCVMIMSLSGVLIYSLGLGFIYRVLQTQ